MVHLAWEAEAELKRRGQRVTVVNARFANPVDRGLLVRLARTQPFLVTLEEASLPGGFGTAVLEALQEEGAPPVRVKRLGIPPELCDHSAREDTLKRLGITPRGVAETAERLLHEKTSHPAW
jgi:1-deoxy-D-xylulose-5-phosphate synthase